MSRACCRFFRKRPTWIACSSEPRSAYSSSIQVSIMAPCSNTLLCETRKGETFRVLKIKMQ